ncbi:uncharacterized protein LOC101849802 [Aplysia californica]|uniref:Uncharacterized protein LOC101849802 n=1 Tax=Aplysia californica TaxID=6500 RepID=A0ABM0K7W7_APLCA|nr:uncharacterized protein LOC101849802 [Aplysia californica]
MARCPVHGALLLVLCISGLVSYVAGGPCSSFFKAFTIDNDDTESEITSSGICLEEYITSDCKSFVKSFNRSFLPSSFEDGSSVQRPASIKLNPLQNEYDSQSGKMLLPGVDIVWDSPISDSAKENLKGFVLTYWTLEGEKGSGCRLFQLDPDKMSFGKTWPKLRFSYELQYVYSNTTLTTTVYSIPTPKPGDHLNTQTFQRTEMRSSQSLPLNDKPGYWVPSVSLQAGGNGKLDVGLSLSPALYNFTEFDLKLLKRSVSEVNYFKKVVFRTQVASANKSSDHFVFEDLEADMYKLVVQPKELFPDESRQCLCWDEENDVTGERHCRLNCDSIMTGWVNLTDGYTGPTSSSSSPTTTFPSTSSSKPASSDMSVGSMKTDSTFIIVTVLVTVAVFVLVLLAVCWYKRRCQFRTCMKDLLSGKEKEKALQSLREKGPFAGPPSPEIVMSTDQKSVMPLSVKTIYVLYSEDHEDHISLVDSLANFLQVHCSCRVIYRRWCDLGPEQGGLAWVVSNINSSDLVLFVASQGAEKFLDAQLSKKVYRQRRLGPEGDLFLLGVQRLLSDGNGSCNQWDNVVPVHFGETRWCRQQMLFPLMYQLPSHLPDMVQKIHKLSPSAAKAHSVNLPLSVETLHELPDGLRLQAAISSAQQYEANNPNWFEENFGSATPILATTACISHTDSDYGSLGPMQSVSSQDVNTSDYMGSPASVFDYPPDFGLYRHPSTRSNPDMYSNALHEYGVQRPRGGGSQRMPRQQKEYVPSVFTLHSDVNDMDKVQQTGDAAGPIRPPETVSDVGTDVMSNALRNVNARHEWAAIPPSVSRTTSPASREQWRDDEMSRPWHPPQGIRPPFELSSIKPPQPCSDMSSDCMSLAFQRVNASSDAIFLDQAPRPPLEEVIEEDSFHGKEQEFDAISV